MIEIWDLDLQLDLGGPIRAEPSQASSVGILRKHPKPSEREYKAVYFGIVARMDSFAAVPTMS